MDETELVGLGQVTAQIERIVTEKMEANQHLDPKYIPIPGDAKGRYLLVEPDGKYSAEMPIPGWLNLQFDTPVDLKQYIEDKRGENGAVDQSSAVFYTEEKIVLIPNMDDRRDRATCKLIKSQVWQAIAALAQPSAPWMQHKEFIRFLRITLRGCITGGNPLLNIIKNIKFNNQGGLEANIQHGNESLGKTILNQVSGTSDIPEEILLAVRVFDNHPFTPTVHCAVELDAENRTFKITPYPLVMKMGMDGAMESIAEVFSDAEIAVYRGTP